MKVRVLAPVFLAFALAACESDDAIKPEASTRERVAVSAMTPARTPRVVRSPIIPDEPASAPAARKRKVTLAAAAPKPAAVEPAAAAEPEKPSASVQPAEKPTPAPESAPSTPSESTTAPATTTADATPAPTTDAAAPPAEAAPPTPVSSTPSLLTSQIPALFEAKIGGMPLWLVVVITVVLLAALAIGMSSTRKPREEI